MDDLTQQQTQARFRMLPSQLRDALADPDTYEKIALVAKKYGLTRVETGLLAQVTGALMLGFIKPNEFIHEIIDYLTTPRDKAMLIAQELNRDIFNDVKNSLKEVHNVNAKKPEVPVGLAPAPDQTLTERRPKLVASSPPISSPSSVVASQQSFVGQAAPNLPNTPPPVAKIPNQPVRSDWGWHGKKNEATGAIEFKHEGIAPATSPQAFISPSPAQTFGKVSASSPDHLRPTSNAQAQILPQQSFDGQVTGAGAAHVGSIFEQKLGGAFTMKLEAPQYGDTTTPPVPTTAPVSSPTTDAKFDLQNQSPRLRLTSDGQARSNLASGFKPPLRPVVSQSPTTGLRVPHKPTQVPIPPAQVFQQPKS